MNLEKIADEFLKNYGISEERSEYLMKVAKFRLLYKHPWRYLFNEEQQTKEAYRWINRYLSIEQARDKKYDKKKI
jgi:hypothetical protein